MKLLETITACLPRLLRKEDPETKRARIENQRKQIGSAVGKVLDQEKVLEQVGYARLSPTEPTCRGSNGDLLDNLYGLVLQLRRVEKRENFPYHYYLRSPDGLIVDRTWQQFLRPYFPPHLPDLRPPLPSYLPDVFVGTREELIALIARHAELPQSENGSMTAEEFVDQQYGLGAHSSGSHEVKSWLS